METKLLEKNIEEKSAEFNYERRSKPFKMSWNYKRYLNVIVTVKKVVEFQFCACVQTIVFVCASGGI